jgi:peptidoglycan/LPS O-acetylase OafA/YrhL
MKNFLKLDLNPKRIYGLDILRALAILFVVIGHGKYLLPQELKSYSKILALDGVSIFFVLSGFLIGGILIRLFEENYINKKLLVKFWVRRWLRTLPNYFLVLIILVSLNFYYSANFTFGGIYKYFFFSQNIFSVHPQFFPEAWSLSIEEWFYLLVPICIFLLINTFKLPVKRSLIIAALAILVMVTIFRFVEYTNIEVVSITEWDSLFRKQVFTRLDSLMYGVIGAYVQYYYNEKWIVHKNLLLLIGVLLLIMQKAFGILGMISVDGLYFSVFSFSLTSFATLCLLPLLSTLKKGRGFFYKWFTYISLISYSMYLLHFSIVQQWIINRIDWGVLLDSNYSVLAIKYILYWALTIILSIMLYKYFEIPMMNLRDSKIVKGLMMKQNKSKSL